MEVSHLRPGMVFHYESTWGHWIDLIISTKQDDVNPRKKAMIVLRVEVRRNSPYITKLFESSITSTALIYDPDWMRLS